MSRRGRVVLAVATAFVALSLASPCLAQQSRARPGFTLTPRSGPVGTLVTYRGHLSSAQTRLLGHARAVVHLFVGAGIRPNGHRCVLSVDMVDDRQTVNDQTGEVTGRFRIGSSGTCEQSRGSRVAVGPGRYLLAVGCTQCTAGRFRVTSSALPFTGVSNAPAMVLAGVVALLAGLGLCHYTGRHRVEP